MPRRRRREPLWDPMGYPTILLRDAVEDSVAALDLPSNARVLDFGCGLKPYRAVFGPDVDYVGADLPGSETADVEIRDGVVDLPDESFDLVLSTQVLEHVTDPDAYLSEARRLVRSEGHLLLTTHGVMFYHPHPTDLWRWTVEGLTSIMTRAGLTPRSISPLLGAVPLGLWLVMMNIQIKLPPGIRHAFVSFFNLAIRWANRRDWDTYRADLVYVVLAQRSTTRGEPTDA